MRASTYFSAYSRAVFFQSNTAYARGTIKGIAIDSDPAAVSWQRRRRQAIKFSAKLSEKLERLESKELDAPQL